MTAQTVTGLIKNPHPEMHGAQLEIEALSKSYDGKTLAVENLNVTLDQGEFLTILGPSGSGKTTALMMLAGFENPTSGEIRLNGVPVSALPAYKRNIGMVFQSYALFPNMSVEENIAYPLKMRNVPKLDRVRLLDAAIELVQLQEHRRKRPGQLSGGQQQRVALARATVFAPGLLLMDEPLGALDRKLRQQMQNEIASLHRTLGVSVVSVTHDQEEALSLSDRILIMANGRVQQIGTPQEVYDRPANAFVADFMGEANVLTMENGRLLQGAVRILGGAGLDLVARTGLVSIRPESVALRPNDAGTGRVSTVTYCGSTVRYEVEVERAGSIICRQAVGSSTPVFARGAGVDIELEALSIVELAEG